MQFKLCYLFDYGLSVIANILIINLVIQPYSVNRADEMGNVVTKKNHQHPETNGL
jgi:hypothetical protein